MNARRRFHRSWVVGVIAAAALSLGAGSVIATAEAAPQARGQSRSEQKARGQKQKVRGQQKKAKQERGSRYQRGDRQNRDRRSEARHESRRGDDRGRYQDRRGDTRDYRGDRDRYVTGRRHARVIVNHRRPHYLPRVIYRPRPIHVRPWFYGARRIYVDNSPFYFHAGLGIFVGGLAVNIQIGDVPPVGYVFYDPFCGETFWSVADYQAHLRFHPHPAALSLIRVEYTDY
jgi:hypothetical protein